jgi:hypothetical protein
MAVLEVRVAKVHDRRGVILLMSILGMDSGLRMVLVVFQCLLI